MRIAHIELLGFKSFVDKTRIVFDKGISVIVGPNGCGKSNVVDAMRWVMGELSAKSLRGSEMMDVIFSGSEQRKPTGMAQVTMAFSCDDGVYPPGYDGINDIEITRRLYRSGDSEYFINRTACRLKDIQELLMDTGMGAKTYAIVEQGQIAKVLSAKPADRRFLVEEAAGITKYRVRREETERKIESTRQNLDRVNDLIGEIKRQVNSLARQAGKARRYKQYSDELRAVDLELTARERIELAEKQAEAERLLAELRERVESTHNDIAARETSQEARHLEHLQAAKALETAQQELASLRERIHAAETEHGRLLREMAEEQARVDTIADETQKAVGSIPDHEQQAEEAAAEVRDNAARLEEGGARLAQLSRALDEHRRDRREKGGRADELRHRIADGSRRAASLDGRIEALDARRIEDAKRAAEFAAQRAAQEERLAALGAQIEQIDERRREWEDSREQVATQVAERAERLRALHEENERLRKAYEDLRAEVREVAAELESLERMKGSLEGYSEGVKHLFAAMEQPDDAAKPHGILGLIGDVMDVPPRFEAAVEAVLGERVQGVLVREQHDGLSAADFLRSAENGRSTFIPMQIKPPRAVYPERTLAQTHGPLAQAVSCQPDFAPAVGALLDDVLVVDDLPTAVRLHNENGYTGAFVTLGGEFVDHYGVITGGSKSALTSGIIEKNRRIRELREELTRRREALAQAEHDHVAGAGMIERLEDERLAAKEELERIRTTLGEIETQARRARTELAAAQNEAARLDEQIRRIDEQQSGREDEIAAARRDLEIQNGDLAAARDELGGLERALIDGSSALDELQSQVTSLTAELAGLRERHRAAADRETRARWALTRIREDLERRQGAAKLSSQKITECREAAGRYESMLGELAAEAANWNDTIAKMRQDLDAMERDLAASDARLRVLRRDADALAQELSRQEVAGLECKMRMEHLAGRLMDKYGMTVDQIPPEYGTDETVDPAVLGERRRELSELLAGMGDVNLAAIEEYEEESKRLEFYTTQKADLETAIADLEKAIAKINKESRVRFLQTFELVSQRFAEVIPMLFGGGQAKMELTDAENPLESGIEISIRPPGKKLTNLNLLSGGEKALSSIGLIFAIFLIKPSPFCLLDEVDAPLDDANIDRFNDLIKLIRAHSQVILITHNKRTMKTAETIYGVSMQEPGVSQIVSVRFEDEDDEPRPARVRPGSDEAVMH